MHTDTIEQPLILASASPRRRELFGLLGLMFGVRVPGVKETLRLDESPKDAVRRLAREKAAAIAELTRPHSYPIIIGADTMVVLDGEVLGKPRDVQEAEKTLRKLRARNHQVYTALSVISGLNGKRLGCTVCTDVPMRDYGDEEIYLYVRSGDPFDKAGAYAIQDADFRPVLALTGCYANVMGLPLCHLARLLARLGIEPPVSVATVCQETLSYSCSEYARIDLAVRRHHSQPHLTVACAEPLRLIVPPKVEIGETE